MEEKYGSKYTLGYNKVDAAFGGMKDVIKKKGKMSTAATFLVESGLKSFGILSIIFKAFFLLKEYLQNVHVVYVYKMFPHSDYFLNKYVIKRLTLNLRILKGKTKNTNALKNE